MRNLNWTITFLIFIIFSALLIAGCAEKPSDSGNLPPAAPTNPSPADGAADQSLDVQLSWQCSDPDGDALTYDVYFGTVMAPPLLASDLSTNIMVLDSLEETAYYYWKVFARDEHKNRAEGPLWWFSTGPIPTVYHIMTFSHPEPIYDYRVKDGLLYLAAEDGLVIVDALRLAEPTVIGTYTPSDTGVYIASVFIRDRYAYLGTCFGGIQIVDISDPSNPILVGQYGWDYPSCTNSIFVQNDYAYIADASCADFHIVDVSDPENPIPIGFYDYPWSGYTGWEVVAAGSYAYYRIACAEGLSDVISIMDVSDPSNPDEITYISTHDYAQNIFVAEDYLYVPYASRHVLRIYDISEPLNPAIISEYPGERETLGVFVQEDYAYAIMGAYSMHVIDVSDPANPQFVAEYVTERQAHKIFVEGPYIYLYDSDDWSQNLHILWFVH